MNFRLDDYLIDQSTIDWTAILPAWSWLLPSNFTLWLVNRFADLFIAFPDGSIHMLDVGGGTLNRLADSREDFCVKIDEDDNAGHWLLIPLVDELAAAGKKLKPGECYAFATPPVLGGEYTVENVNPLPITSYLSLYAEIHQQLKDLPEGTKVVLRLED